MQLNISQIINEINLWATAHGEVNSFHFGHPSDVYHNGNGIVNHPALIMDINTGDFNGNLSTFNVQIMIATLPVAPENEPLNQSVNDALNKTNLIIRNLYDTISTAPKWTSKTQVQNASFTKFSDSEADRVCGWLLTFNLAVLTQHGTCNVPLFDYDTEGEFASSCMPVSVYENGALVATVPAGQSYSYNTGVESIDFSMYNSDGLLLSSSTETENFEVIAPDAYFELYNRAGNFLSSGSTASTEISVIEAPNVDIKINGLPFNTYPSGGYYNITLRNIEGNFIPFEQVGNSLKIHNSTYTISDQFGNYIASGSSLPVSHTDINVELPNNCEILLDGFVTIGAGSDELNGEWFWNEEEGVYENSAKTAVYELRGGQWVMVAGTEDMYITTEGSNNPWQNTTWTVVNGDAPAPSFVQLTESCCDGISGGTFSIQIGTDIYGEFSGGTIPKITVIDSNGNVVDTVQSDNNKVQIPALPCEIPSGGTGTARAGGIHKFYVESLLQPQAYAGMDGTDYYTLSTENYFGNTMRFTGKNGGGYDGSGYVDVDGNSTTSSLAFPDDMVLIHDMTGVYNESSKQVLCMKRNVESAQPYANHISDSNALVHGGIGPNRWFMGRLPWYLMLADCGSGNDAFKQAPFGISTSSYITCSDEHTLGVAQTNSFRIQYNQPSIRNKTGSDACIYWCWYDLIND